MFCIRSTLLLNRWGGYLFIKPLWAYSQILLPLMPQLGYNSLRNWEEKTQIGKSQNNFTWINYNITWTWYDRESIFTVTYIKQMLRQNPSHLYTYRHTSKIFGVYNLTIFNDGKQKYFVKISFKTFSFKWKESH